MNTNFTFPDNVVITNGSIRRRKLVDSEDSYQLVELSELKENLIQIDGVEYYFYYLNNNGRHKGGNSIVFKLFEAQNFDVDNDDLDEPDLVLKISKKRNRLKKDNAQLRFEQEIEALNECFNKGYQNVIQIQHAGECRIFDTSLKRFTKHLYYSMEYAPHDLKTFIESFHPTLTLEKKMNLCIELAKGLKELSSLGYYHRDLKPDNIFFTADGKWKIADLGLMKDRNKKLEIDQVAEYIGPKGWLSPESMNKYLTEEKGFSEKFDCKIDHQSDIFQLGKIFWYVFQHNAPVGCVKESDFRIKNSNLYSIIKPMLSHSKKRRYSSIEKVIELLTTVERKMLLL